jgi:NADH-quinone oxidoreductase subunit M
MAVLSYLLFTPILGAIALLFLKNDKAIKVTALAFALLPLLLSMYVFWQFNPDVGGMQFVEKYSWIPQYGISFHLGVDGFSLPLVLLTTLLSLLVVIYAQMRDTDVKAFNALLLFLMAGMLGTFMSLDLFLFFIFWEVSLVPMYFLIGIWGGGRRLYSAIKFFIYTLVGSVGMLLGILILYFNTPERTFDLLTIIQTNTLGTAGLLPIAVFWLFFVGFAVKVPVWPFHTWLPDAHVDAPTEGSVILAGVLLKMGTYGFVRILMPVVPEVAQRFAWVVGLLAVIGIVYGAYCAMAQSDLKKLIAYSSVNHMAYVMLGLAAAMAAGGSALAKTAALNGAVLQMVNHGIITGALFLLVGVIYTRTHTREIADFGGLRSYMPVYSALFSVSAFASLGLPGLAGFVSEFLVFAGSYGVYPVFVAVSLIGVVVTAAYLLWTVQRIFLGAPNERWKSLSDMTLREKFVVGVLCVLMVLLGVAPTYLLSVINSATMVLLG